VDEVKIDQVFVFGMNTHKKDERIVRATVQLAHSLDLEAAAEDVEDEDTLNRLFDLGCDTAQGYHIAKTKPAEEFEQRFIQTQPN
jgi:EAL domain-containing protein (putative c-di-GMP-specific phosphodiesterase class I)